MGSEFILRVPLAYLLFFLHQLRACWIYEAQQIKPHRRMCYSTSGDCFNHSWRWRRFRFYHILFVTFYCLQWKFLRLSVFPSRPVLFWAQLKCVRQLCFVIKFHVHFMPSLAFYYKVYNDCVKQTRRPSKQLNFWNSFGSVNIWCQDIYTSFSDFPLFRLGKFLNSFDHRYFFDFEICFVNI